MVDMHIFQILTSSGSVLKKDKTEPFVIDFLDRLALVNCEWQSFFTRRRSEGAQSAHLSLAETSSIYSYAQPTSRIK